MSMKRYVKGIMLMAIATGLSAQGFINNGATVKVKNGTTMVIADATNGDLTNTSGTFMNYADLYIRSDLVNNGTFINGSDATGDGRIMVDGTISGSGTSVAERYYSEQTNDGSKPTGRWWYITPGVSNARSDSILAATDQGRIWEYIEPSNAWSQITTDVALTDLRGYATKAGSDQSISFAGDGFFDGTHSVAVTSDGNGWNLVGNPYPTTIDIDAVLERNVSLVNESVWIRTNKQYASWNSVSDIGSNGGTQYVSKMQAFWLLCETPGSFEFQDADKNSSEVSMMKSLETKVQPTFRMIVTNDDLGDEAILAVRQGAETYFERFDTQKKPGSASAEIYYILETGEMLTANVIPAVPDTGNYPIGLEVKEHGNYTIRCTSLEGFDDNTVLYIEDLLAGYRSEIAEGEEYTFEADAGTLSDRFRIVLGTVEEAAEGEETAISEKERFRPVIYAFRKKIHIRNVNLPEGSLEVQVTDLLGRQVIREELQGSGHFVIDADAVPGVYIVRVRAAGKQFSDKIVLSN